MGTRQLQLAPGGVARDTLFTISMQDYRPASMYAASDVVQHNDGFWIASGPVANNQVPGVDPVWKPLGLDDIWAKASSTASDIDVLFDNLAAPGAWSAASVYNGGDVVVHGGHVWIATANNAAGAEPGVAADWSSLTLEELFSLARAAATPPAADFSSLVGAATDWVAQAYNANDVVLHNGHYWLARVATQAAEEPGVDAKWRSLLLADLWHASNQWAPRKPADPGDDNKVLVAGAGDAVWDDSPEKAWIKQAVAASADWAAFQTAVAGW